MILFMLFDFLKVFNKPIYILYFDVPFIIYILVSKDTYIRMYFLTPL